MPVDIRMDIVVADTGPDIAAVDMSLGIVVVDKLPDIVVGTAVCTVLRVCCNMEMAGTRALTG